MRHTCLLGLLGHRTYHPHASHGHVSGRRSREAYTVLVTPKHCCWSALILSSYADYGCHYYDYYHHSVSTFRLGCPTGVEDKGSRNIPSCCHPHASMVEETQLSVGQPDGRVRRGRRCRAQAQPGKGLRCPEVLLDNVSARG